MMLRTFQLLFCNDCFEIKTFHVAIFMDESIYTNGKNNSVITF